MGRQGRTYGAHARNQTPVSAVQRARSATELRGLGGTGRDRTGRLMLAKHAPYQLRYSPGATAMALSSEAQTIGLRASRDSVPDRYVVLAEAVAPGFQPSHTRCLQNPGSNPREPHTSRRKSVRRSKKNVA